MYTNKFTGKPIDKLSDMLPRESDAEYCENGHDDTKLIYNCVQCGAPVCCPDCCNEEYESRGA